jgi:sec-independent protein translocase protein TatB
MFDVGASELLLIVIVAIIVIGPKDLPLALRTAGQWMGKIRRISGHFRSGIESMIREAELAEMEEKWRKQNEAIMTAHPAVPENGIDESGGYALASAEAGAIPGALAERSPEIRDVRPAAAPSPAPTA